MIDPVIASGSILIVAFGGYHGLIKPLNRKKRPHKKSFAKIIINTEEIKNKETPK